MLAAALKTQIEIVSVEFEAQLRAFAPAVVGENVPNLHDAVHFALGTDITDPALRGKRIRPLLCLLTAEALGSPRAHAMPFAIAIELMHNFALVHDDMEDGDIMRRGREAVWIKYGIPHGINIGDYLLVQSSAALTEWGTPELRAGLRFNLLRLLTEALDHTHIGQALDINFRHVREFSTRDYLRIVREKTGYYLAAPIQGGALVAGAEEEILERIGKMAQFLGPLFQIMDDIIDLTEGKGRESAGSDIREGKRSYLVAHAAETGSSAQRESLFEILDKPRNETSADDVQQVSQIFQGLGSIEAGRNYCRELYEQSQKELASLPSELRETLGGIFNSLVNRSR